MAVSRGEESSQGENWTPHMCYQTDEQRNSDWRKKKGLDTPAFDQTHVCKCTRLYDEAKAKLDEHSQERFKKRRHIEIPTHISRHAIAESPPPNHFYSLRLAIVAHQPCTQRLGSPRSRAGQPRNANIGCWSHWTSSSSVPFPPT